MRIRTTSVRLGLDFRARFERSTETPLVLMTQRSRLDAFLAEQAADAGAEFRDGARVNDITLLDDGVRATVDGHKVAANWMFCADGVNGTAARTIGLDDGRTYGVALEGNVAYGVVAEEDYRGKLFLELANVPGGYGWVFPKGDHVNVGVGGWEREGPRLRQHLSRFCREYGIPESSLENVRGYRLPLLHARARLTKGAQPCSETRPAWSTRCRATASTRRSSPRSSPSRRSSPATSRRTTASSAERSRPSWRPRGARRSRSTASRA